MQDKLFTTMGAVNYKTSKFITLALKPYNYDDFANDEDIMREIEEDVSTLEEAIPIYISYCYDCDMYNVKYELEKCVPYYFPISIVPGYYEGFSLDISENLPDELEDWEREEALEELEDIRECLKNCAGLGMMECSPGLCTHYSDYLETCDAIDRAIETMRGEIDSIPAYIAPEEAGAENIAVAI